MNRRLPLLILLLLLLVACSPRTDAAPTATTESVPTEPAPAVTDAPSGDLAPVRVGIVPVTIYAPFYIAVEKGYFAEEGLDVQLMPVDGGTENVVQVAAGNFEVAGGGIGAGLFNAIDRGIEFEIVLPMHTERPPLTSPFVISKATFDSGEITRMADLRGRTVSTNAAGSATEYWLWKALQQGGLDFPDVTVTSVGFREVAAALESGSIDGAILGEPLATLAEQQGLVHRLSEDFLDSFTPTMVYFNREWATANPEQAQGFVRAFLRAARDLNGDGWTNPEHLAMIEKYTNVPADVIAQANRSYHDPNGAVPADDIAALQDFFMTHGSLSYDTPIDMTPYIVTDYATRAVESLGGPVEWK